MKAASLRWTAARIVLTYVVAAATWILASDLLPFRQSYLYSAGKGVLFVLLTATLLYSLLRRYQNEIQAENRTAKELAARFQQFADKAPFGIFIQSEGVIRYINPAGVRLFGAVAEDQLIGRAVTDHIGSLPKLDPGPKDLLMLRLDYKPFWVETIQVPIEHNGEPAHLVYISDITERVNRLRNYEQIAETLSAIVWITQEGNAVRYLNDYWYEYTGQSRWAVRETWIEALHPEDRPRFLQIRDAASLALKPYEVRVRYRRHDGEYRWFLARGVPVAGSGAQPSYWFGVATDVDEPARLIEHMQRAAEEERLRISRDLHDDLGQLLVAAKLSIEIARREPSGAGDRLAKARDAVIAAVQRTRNLASMLRPPALDSAGLSRAIQNLAEDFQSSTGVQCSYASDAADDLNLPAPVVLAFYRTVQEALTNAAKHAGASLVSVQLRRTETSLKLAVRDNGHGMQANAGGMRGFGLAGMRERAIGVGAILTIESGATGTELRLEYLTPPALTQTD